MSKWQRVKYHPNLPLNEDGKRVTGCKEHTTLSKNAAKEGMVLLKNENGLLPIKKGQKVALFGKGSIDYVKGGGGSGDVTVAYTINLYEGLKQLDNHVNIFDNLSCFYKEYVAGEYLKGNEPGMIAEPNIPDKVFSDAKEFTDTAIITVSRFSGEGWDRRSTLDKEIEFLAEDDREFYEKAAMLFERGDFYLSKAEKCMITKVKANFAKVIVVLNVGCMVDTEWFANDKGIQSVLMAWQGGIEGGLAAAELLCGIGNPSGKLSDTFAKSLEDYPSSYNFHESQDYVDYTEDIYVGYRYFETIPNAKGAVNYPFGYGLSYTTFEHSVVKQYEEDGEIHVHAIVKNTGDIAGKEVVQLYVCPPQGVLGKPNRNLAAFKKTGLLKAGESQTIELSIPISSMASYDDVGKIEKSAYVLEAGEYAFFVGTSVRDCEKIEYAYKQKENAVTQKLSQKIAPTSLKKRMLSDGSYEELPQREEVDTDASALKDFPNEFMDGAAPYYPSAELQKKRRESNAKIDLMDVVDGKISMDDFIEKLSDEDLAHLLGGQPNVGVANTYGIGNIEEYSIPNVMTADGPAGLRIRQVCGVTTTAWPCSTLLACTWNEDIVYAVGQAGAKEVKENNIGVWLTPAVNIHRSPLCGRNFEYYSEDPYLVGKMASAMVKGMQSQNIAATVKHFALNNKETNRRNSDSRVSERAAREIYLKPFELIVKESNPWCIMSAYNIINGYRASENRELLEDILRDEWGFEGMVTTDWWTFGEHYKEVKAGNDLKMGCGFPERILLAIEKGAIQRKEIEICVKRILEFIIKID